MPAKFDMPLRRSPKSDPQQYRVYRMENEAIGARQYMQLTRGKLRALVRGVCKNYHVPAPAVSWADLGRWSAEWREQASERVRGIVFNPSKKIAHDILTVTHELAHHLHYCLSAGAWQAQESHGPEFMACHMSILDTYRVIPVVGMRAVCAAWEVRFHDPGTRQSLARLQQICRGKA